MGPRRQGDHSGRDRGSIVNWRSHCTQTWVAGDGIEQGPNAAGMHKYTCVGTRTDSYTHTHTPGHVTFSAPQTAQSHVPLNIWEHKEQKDHSQSKGICDEDDTGLEYNIQRQVGKLAQPLP